MTDFWIFGLKIGIRNIECKFFDDKLPERSGANFEADNSSCCWCGIALGKKGAPSLWRGWRSVKVMLICFIIRRAVLWHEQ